MDVALLDDLVLRMFFIRWRLIRGERGIVERICTLSLTRGGFGTLILAQYFGTCDFSVYNSSLPLGMM